MKRRRRAAAPALLLSLLLAAVPAAAGPRIVSLNLCADQLVLLLADRADIASVTWLAGDCDMSALCERAVGLPVNHATAEAMLAAAPDLVLSGRYTARSAVAVAKRSGIAVTELEAPQDFDAVRDQIRRVAAVLRQPERGEAAIAAFDRKLAAIPPPPPPEARPVGAVYQANGFTVGVHSLIDRMLARAGIENMARRLGIDNYPYLPLESLIAGRPDLLILDNPREPRPSLAGAILKHPALERALAPQRRAIVPQRLWICGGPWVADALALLVQARERAAALPR